MTDERMVTLTGMEFWQDDVGSRFVKAATGSVERFNEESLALWQRIEALAAFQMEDIRHEPQRSRLEEMRVEFDG